MLNPYAKKKLLSVLVIQDLVISAVFKQSLCLPKAYFWIYGLALDCSG